jgi:hypothetical protein
MARAPQDEDDRSRDAFFSARVLPTTKDQAPKQIVASGSSCFVDETPLIDSLPARKKEAERRQTHCLLPARKRRAGRATRKAACAALRLRARSPAGVPPRFSPRGLSSPGLSIGPGFPRRNVKLRRAATRHLGHSDAPRAPVLVPAGMMPEPPGCGVYLSARGRRTRSADREYPPGKRPLKSEIDRRYCHHAGEVKRRRVFFDESSRSHCAFFLERRGTPMIRSGKPLQNEVAKENPRAGTASRSAVTACRPKRRPHRAGWL